MTADAREEEGALHGERAPSESVVVDIGGDMGALIVTTEATMEGAEIEICPVGSAARTHTVVRPRRPPGGGLIYAAVFQSLPAGDYALLGWESMPGTVVKIQGGAITQFDW